MKIYKSETGPFPFPRSEEAIRSLAKLRGSQSGYKFVKHFNCCTIGNDKIKILPDATGREAMKKLNKTGEKCLVVVDDNDTLLGTLSDGDLRKAILNGIHMSDSIKSIYSDNPSVLIENNFNDEDVKKLFLNKKFDLIPIVSEKKKLIDVLFWDKVFNGDDHFEKNINVPVVIMAGGEGTRLALTNILLNH